MTPAQAEVPYVDAVQAHRWQLYDVTGIDRQLDYHEWQVLEQRGPTQQLEEGGQYLLGPVLAAGQSLGGAYARLTEIHMPGLRIGNVASSDYPHLELHHSSTFAVFSRLALDAHGVRLYTPEMPEQSFSDVVILDRHTGPVVFARDFGLVPIRDVRQVYKYRR